MSNDKKQIRISEVLGLLQDGKTREDIAQHYGLTQADVKRMFQHPALKGKKTIKKRELPFSLVEDSEVGDNPVVESPHLDFPHNLEANDPEEVYSEQEQE